MIGDDAAELERCRIIVATFKKLEQVIRSVAYRYSRNPSDIDEATQEVFLRMLTAPTLRMNNPRAFVITITRNVCLDILRHKQIVPIEYIPDLDTQHEHALGLQADVCDVLEAEEDVELVLAAADHLPDACRRIFLLRKIYGCSQREISQMLGISENTVEQHLGKAAIMVAAALESTGPDKSNVISLALYGIGTRRWRKGQTR